MKASRLLCILLVFFFTRAWPQSEMRIKVHFLHGSKPARGHRDVERKWFGGILGGHVGIETEEGSILNFMKKGKVHWFARSGKKNSRYAVHDPEGFWGIFRYPAGTVKKTTVVIPLTAAQKFLLDSIAEAYLRETPYDYAFFGMRCGAATYEILAKLELVKPYSYRRTYLKIFYPRRLRRRLLQKAALQDWEVIRQEGSAARIWEKD